MTVFLRLRSSRSNGHLRVDREAGAIFGVSVIASGKTLPSSGGNGPFEVDAITLQQVADAINASQVGIKSRITHPEADGTDDLPMRLGYIRNARVAGSRVIADMHFHDSGDSGAKRIMSIAEADPTSCGLSIVSNTCAFDSIQDGTGLALRISNLDAVDWVGSPAANPTGMLSANYRNLSTKGFLMFTQAQAEHLKAIGLPEGADIDGIAAFVAGLDEEQKAALEALAEVGTIGETPDPVTSEEEQAKLSERKRCREIHQIALSTGLGNGWAERHITAGTAVAEFRRDALNSLKRAPEDMQTTRVTLGWEPGDSISQAVTDAVALRLGAKLKVMNPQAQSLRHRPLVEMGRVWLNAAGVQGAYSLTAAQVAAKLMNSRGLALSQSTSDFPHLLADALGKTLRIAYQETPTTWTAWAGRRVAADFKDIKPTALHNFPNLRHKPEGDSVTFVSLADSSEVYQLKTYSIGTKLTREAIVNDDLSAFDRLPQMASASARRLEDDLVYAQLTGNPVLGETGSPLFSTGHKNIGAGAIGNASVSSGRVAMALQVDKVDAVLNLRPAALLVPVELEDEARALVAAQELRQSGAADSTYVTNPYSFLKTLQVVSDPRLSRHSAVQWYLATSPQQCDTVEIAFLEGEEMPVIDEETDFNTDCHHMKVRHTVAARAIDFRGLYRSAGV